ncbi:MAG: sulfotransferase domain-containing protein [Candidatus Electrothrix aestuarii]|uniref:Sulfotransferase domain-containing protein n=1 Tax=Candidatus Electrothrix aestuarii TaxID=3062594 RepID=A0AAU8LSS7_9BACT|nr:sulfotransferase [Candidatus Electrothrix aestuarii]
MEELRDKKKPDFICVGPEKTGTTWLYKILGQHPEVWLPMIKELRYLNEGNLFSEHSIKNVLFSSHWHYRALRRCLMRKIAKQFYVNKISISSRYRQTLWILTYCFGSRSFDWYSNLYPKGAAKLGGDISPMYYGIPEARIMELHKHNENTKILLFIRNPIDRVWSKAKMNLCIHKARDFNKVSHEEFISVFDEVFRSWQPYIETINLWERYFSDVFVGFYDALEEDAAKLFEDICSFLGISTTVKNSSISVRVNKGIGEKIPNELFEHLRDQYRNEINTMAKKYGEYPKRWIDPLQDCTMLQ